MGRVNIRASFLAFVLPVVCFLKSLDAEIGAEKWTFETGEAIFASPTLDSEGNLYFGTLDANVYSVDKDGVQRWVSSAGDWVQSSAALSNDESTLYLGSWDNSLYAFDSSNGQILWTYETGSLIYASPAIANDGTIYFGSSDGFLYALDSNGQLKWEAFVGGELDASVAIGIDGELYVASTEGTVLSFDSDGNERWAFDVPAEAGALNREDVIAASCVLSGQGALYIGCENYFFYALDTSDGSLLWKYETGGEIDASATLSIDGNILFSSLDGYIYSLDTNGDLVWRTLIGENYFTSAVVDEIGRIYVCSTVDDTSNYLNLLSPDGTLLQQVPFSNIIDASVAIGPDGILYLCGYDGALRAYRNGARLSNSVWPKFRKNLAARGNMENYSAPVAGKEEFFNIALRGSPSGGQNDIIAGFVVAGAGEKNLLVRGVGPGLESLGIESVLENPKVEFYGPDGGGKFAENLEWEASASASTIADEMARVGAFALAEGSLDSSEILTLGAGLYTAVMSSGGGEDGVALLEVYDADDGDSGARLVNISMRGRSGQGEEVLIAGFVVNGNLPRRVLIRAVGPGIASKGVGDPLLDPTLSLYRGSGVLDSNDDWETHPDRDLLEAFMEGAGAFDLDPESKDSALFVWLEPGLYTAIVSSADGGTGVALVEVYDLTGL